MILSEAEEGGVEGAEGSCGVVDMGGEVEGVAGAEVGYLLGSAQVQAPEGALPEEREGTAEVAPEVTDPVAFLADLALSAGQGWGQVEGGSWDVRGDGGRTFEPCAMAEISEEHLRIFEVGRDTEGFESRGVEERCAEGGGVGEGSGFVGEAGFGLEEEGRVAGLGWWDAESLVLGGGREGVGVVEDAGEFGGGFRGKGEFGIDEAGGAIGGAGVPVGVGGKDLDGGTPMLLLDVAGEGALRVGILGEEYEGDAGGRIDGRLEVVGGLDLRVTDHAAE